MQFFSNWKLLITILVYSQIKAAWSLSRLPLNPNPEHRNSKNSYCISFFYNSSQKMWIIPRKDKISMNSTKCASIKDFFFTKWDFSRYQKFQTPHNLLKKDKSRLQEDTCWLWVGYKFCIRKWFKKNNRPYLFNYFLTFRSQDN